MARWGKHWDDNLCAEHDGTIAGFASLGRQLDDIEDFESIFERKSTDLLRAAKIGAGVAAGVVVFAPAAFLAAPGIASAIGSMGVLGAAGTGTAISSLSGAALTSASLAAVGGGTMAAGTAVMAAVGGALGGYKSAVISNSYLGKVDHFDIRKIKAGNRHAVIFVNGFLSQGETDVEDWTEHLQSHFMRQSWYHLDWESKALHKLGSQIAAAPRAAGMEMAKGMAKRAAKASAAKMSPLAMINNVTDLLGNPWHTSMVKAQMTGVMLADAIARTKGWRFTLAGHSLGARAIYYALQILSTKHGRRIENVYLLGGAVGGDKKDDDDWCTAAKAVRGIIHNCYSKHDDVLRYLYQGSNGWRSRPIGYLPINYENEKILNFDCSALVSGHMEWKDQFGEILTQLREYRAV